MKISSLFNSDRTVLSFEVFPPKKNGSVETVYNTIAELQSLRPDYISVTYGAGGSAANNYTCDIASLIKNKYGIEAMAHLTCVNSTKEDVDRVLNELKENNIENILALRGDKNPDFEPKTDFTYANDLVSYIKAKGDFGISVAGYPETHFEAPNGKKDVVCVYIDENGHWHTVPGQLNADGTYTVDFSAYADSSKYVKFAMAHNYAGNGQEIVAGTKITVSSLSPFCLVGEKKDGSAADDDDDDDSSSSSSKKSSSSGKKSPKTGMDETWMMWLMAAGVFAGASVVAYNKKKG